MGNVGSKIHSIFFFALFVSLAFLNFPTNAFASVSSTLLDSNTYSGASTSSISTSTSVSWEVKDVLLFVFTANQYYDTQNPGSYDTSFFNVTGGAGLHWSVVGTNFSGDVSAGTIVLAGVPDYSGSGTLTGTFLSADQYEYGHLSLIKITGASKTNPIRQRVFGADYFNALSLSYASTFQSGSGGIAIIATEGNPTFTPQSGWTELDDAAVSTSFGMTVQARSTADTSCGGTSSVENFTPIICFEIGAADPSPVASMIKAPSKLGLMAYWPFDEMTNAGALTGDFSGNNLSATVSGPDIVTGKLGKAFRYASASAEYVIRALSGTTLTQTTVSFWVKPTTTPGSQSGMFQWANTPNAGAPFILFAYDTSNNFRVYVDGDYRVTTPLPLNKWSYVTMTLDGSNLWTFYINGVSIGTYQDDYTHSNQSNGTSVYFGNGYNAYFDGQIDEARIYNRGLTSSEVWKLYKTGGVTYRQPNNLGLVGYWPLNEGRGTIAGDFSGNGKNGTLTNISSPATSTSGWANGKLGKAVNFELTDDNININPIIPSMSVTEGSISVWVKTNSTAAGYRTIIDLRTDGSNEVQIYDAFGQDGNNFQMGYYAGGVQKQINASSLALGQWYHLVLTWSVTSDQAKGYINGVQFSTTQTGLGTWSGAVAGAVIGNNTNSNGAWTGTIDEVRVYNRAITADEVKALYSGSKYILMNTSPTNKLINGLVGYWTFDGGDTNWAGPTTTDRSGNSSTGTMTNMNRKTTPSSGKYGQSFYFDGSDDYVTAGNISSLNMGTSDWTTSAWVKTSNVSIQPMIVSKETFVGGVTDGWYMQLRNNGHLLAGIYKNGRTHFQTADDGASVSDNQWHHVVGVWNRSGNLLRYVDGVVTGAALDISSESAQNISNGREFQIGGRDESTDPLLFNGSIDDVRVYNRALSAAEVLSLYRTGK